MSEWLRRWTRNPLGSAREGSNPFAVVFIAKSCQQLNNINVSVEWEIATFFHWFLFAYWVSYASLFFCGVDPLQHLRCLDARVVKGVDLRSTGLQAAWVRTPLQASFDMQGQEYDYGWMSYWLPMMCPLWGLNPWPLAHKTNALTTELKGRYSTELQTVLSVWQFPEQGFGLYRRKPSIYIQTLRGHAEAREQWENTWSSCWNVGVFHAEDCFAECLWEVSCCSSNSISATIA